MKIQFISSFLMSATSFALSVSSGSRHLAKDIGASLALIAEEPLATFKYSTNPPSDSNWVGIYNALVDMPPEDNHVAWEWADQPAGSVFIDVSDLAHGAYKAFFFAGSGYDRILGDPVPFNIGSRLALDTEKPLATFNYSTNLFDDNTWVGIYNAFGDTPPEDNHVAWEWADQPAGSVLVDMSDLPDGAYKAFFFAGSGYDRILGDPVPFNIGSRLVLDTDKPLATFNYSTNLPSDSNWVGIYNALGDMPPEAHNYVTWVWADQPAGSVFVDVSHFQYGTYKAFFFAGSGYDRILGDPVPFTVDPAPPSSLPSDGHSVPDLSEVQLITDKYLFNISLEEFGKNRQITFPNYLDWTSDGCTLAFDNPLGFSFLPGCKRHDFGYRNYKKQSRFTPSARAKIDEQFEQDLYHQCHDYTTFARVLCDAAAKLYYAGLRFAYHIGARSSEREYLLAQTRYSAMLSEAYRIGLIAELDNSTVELKPSVTDEGLRQEYETAIAILHAALN